jgi:two-component system cell cycle sensor histidine kinase/response regulator CckA
MPSILVVDDDPAVLKMTADVLAREGYEVLRAASPLEAISAVKANSKAVDLMLIDAVLPAMSGPELAEQMLSLYPSVKILFMTGLDALSITLAFGKPCETIQKPFQLTSLKTRVASMLGGS